MRINGVRLTVSDYGWSAAVVSSRRDVYEASRQVRVEEFNVEIEKQRAYASMEQAKQKINDIGRLTGGISRVLQLSSHGWSREEAQRTAERLVMWYKSADEEALNHISLGLDNPDQLGDILNTVANGLNAFFGGGNQPS